MTEVNEVAQHAASQKHARDNAIACLTQRLSRYQQTPVELKAQIQPHLEVLSALGHKLSQPLLQIAVFGLVSRGKSAVLNALFGETLFPTGPLNGVTQWPRSVRWSLTAAPKIQLELIDTPGLDEISGEARALMAQEIARCADLILFVTAGPPMPVELDALSELAQLSKPILWVVNKADLYPELNAETLYQSLTNQTLQAILSPQEIVLASAAPAPIQVRHEWPDGRTSTEWENPPPQIEPLRQALLNLLNREGEYLLSLNVLLQAQATERQIVEAIAHYYATPLETAQGQLWGIKSVLVGLNPWGMLDLLFSFLMDVAQVRQRLQRQNLPVTRHNVSALWKTLYMSTGYLGLAEICTSGVGNLLNGPDGIPIVGGLVQGAIALYGASLVSKSAQCYLREGATWDSQGPSTVIQTMLTQLSPEMVVYRLVEAFSTTLVLPPPPSEGPTLIKGGQERANGLSQGTDQSIKGYSTEGNAHG
jgi:uncharacterized protein